MKMARGEGVMGEENGVHTSEPLTSYAQSTLALLSMFFTLCTLRFTSILITIHKTVKCSSSSIRLVFIWISPTHFLIGAFSYTQFPIYYYFFF
ncbi:hypothetical protein ACSBR1_015744 [Camellia fascicularis]